MEITHNIQLGLRRRRIKKDLKTEPIPIEAPPPPPSTNLLTQIKLGSLAISSYAGLIISIDLAAIYGATFIYTGGMIALFCCGGWLIVAGLCATVFCYNVMMLFK
jgi:hypothetical protein